MKKSDSDSPIVERIREVRKKIWAEYGNDVHQVFEAMRKDAEIHRKQGQKFADDLKPCLPPDFEERVERLRAERTRPAA